MSVMLSFGGGSSANGAWDDRELVKSYDAAMEEFHLHHPGPGSWLDKMTAEQGEAASSSKQTDTAWYTASEPRSDTQEEIEPPAASSSSQRPTKRPRKVSHHARSDSRPTNPYSTATNTSAFTAGPASPQYSPPSPSPPAAADEMILSPRLNDAGLESEQARIPVTTAMPYPPPPAPISVTPTNHVSAADAVTYAMTAQYWAGYWMGVSQALQTADRRAPVAEMPEEQAGHQAVRDSRSNVVKTKHQVLKR